MDKNIVKIILIATDTKRKSLVFVDENLKVYSLQEAILATQNGLFKNVYTVNRSGNLYLRSTRDTPAGNKLDRISISSYQLFYSLNDIGKILSIPAFKNYWQKYQQNLLQEQEEGKDTCIIIDDHPRITKANVRSKLISNKELIFSVAEKFNVDPYLLAAILVDEIARLNPIEDITDMLSVKFLGINTSVGIAQVKVETARGLMLADCYNPDSDKFSSKEKIRKATVREIYEYIKQPKYSIFFASATMRNLVDNWKKFIDLNKNPEILASLYSMHKTPHKNPEPNDRGLQIANEFYKLAKEWLK
jgi:hypothetical protein